MTLGRVSSLSPAASLEMKKLVTVVELAMTYVKGRTYDPNVQSGAGPERRASRRLGVAIKEAGS
jgi:hypothetical protein